MHSNLHIGFVLLGVTLAGCGAVQMHEESWSEVPHALAEDDLCGEKYTTYGRIVFMPVGEYRYSEDRRHGSVNLVIVIRRDDKPVYYPQPTGSPTGGPPQIAGYVRRNHFEIFKCLDEECDSRRPYPSEEENHGILLFDSSASPVRVTQLFDVPRGADSQSARVNHYSISNFGSWNKYVQLGPGPYPAAFNWDSRTPGVSNLRLEFSVARNETPDCQLNWMQLGNCDRIGQPKWCPTLSQCRQLLAWNNRKPHMKAVAESCSLECVNKQTRDKACFECENGYTWEKNVKGEYDCLGRVP